jgi:hypothetical protein
MSRRRTKRWKIPKKIPVSRQSTFEFCRRPSTLIVFCCLSVATVLTVWNSRSDVGSVSDADPTDEELSLALGALGFSDSANPNSAGVQARFDFDDDGENSAAPEPSSFRNESAYLNRATVSSATPDFEPSFGSASPRFGRPMTVPDSRTESAIQQTGFRQSDDSIAVASGARVTANQAVWLTGSIEAR